MDTKRIKEMLSDEALAKELLELKTTVELQAALKEKGIDIPESEIAGLMEELVKAAENGDGISLNQLDDVAGGNVSAFNKLRAKKEPRR